MNTVLGSSQAQRWQSLDVDEMKDHISWVLVDNHELFDRCELPFFFVLCYSVG